MGAPPSSSDPYDGFGAKWGYDTDSETGLVLCTWRYYDPQLGRWVTRDPIGYSGGVNLYGYVNNNPIRRTDPIGLQYVDIGIVTAAQAAAQSSYADTMAAIDLATFAAGDVTAAHVHNTMFGAEHGGSGRAGAGRRKYAIGGHGEFDNHWSTVPEDCSVTMAKPGLTMQTGPDSVGWKIASCNPPSDILQAMVTFKAGDKFPNLMVTNRPGLHYPDGTIMPYVGERLSSLIASVVASDGPGDFYVAICTANMKQKRPSPYAHNGYFRNAGIYLLDGNGGFSGIIRYGDYPYNW